MRQAFSLAKSLASSNERREEGNFFLEPLAKSGAADKYQIYGQAGLDYGAEWYHGKITGLGTSFTAPEYSKKVFVGFSRSYGNRVVEEAHYR